MNEFSDFNVEVQEYFKILAHNEFPIFLFEYINTPAMQRIKK